MHRGRALELLSFHTANKAACKFADPDVLHKRRSKNLGIATPRPGNRAPKPTTTTSFARAAESIDELSLKRAPALPPLRLVRTDEAHALSFFYACTAALGRVRPRSQPRLLPRQRPSVASTLLLATQARRLWRPSAVPPRAATESPTQRWHDCPKESPTQRWHKRPKRACALHTPDVDPTSHFAERRFNRGCSWR